MTTLSIDIETYSGTDLATSGVYKYVEDPDFEILLIAYSFDNENVNVLDLANLEPSDFFMLGQLQEALVNGGFRKTAWNAAFEITCLSKYFGIDLDPAQWDCSMVRAANAGLPLSLGECAKVIGNGEQKMSEGKALVKYFCEPCKPTKVNGGRTRNLPDHNPEKWAKFIEYCRQDVVTEMDIRSKLMFVKYTETERKLWRLDQMINRRGVAVDLSMVRNAIAMDAVNREALIEEAKQITGLSNPNSGPQLKDWLNANISTQVDSLTKEDVIYLIEVISKGNCSFRNGLDKDTVLRVLEIKRKLSKTSVKKYSAIVESACSDNRVKGLLQFYGANRTGRWAGRIVQLHNLPRNMMRDLDLARQLIVNGSYEEFHLWYDDLSQPLSELIRTAFVPSEGNTFAVADFSAIEARVIAWLAGEEWVLEVFRTHGKIYEATAAKMFSVKLEDVTKDLRGKGKVSTLSLGFQGSVEALERMGGYAIYAPLFLSRLERLKNGRTLVSDFPEILMCDYPQVTKLFRTDNKMSEAILREWTKYEVLGPLVVAWRKENPHIVQLWYDVQRAAIQAVENGTVVVLKQKGIRFIGAKNMLFVELPSGRRLSYVRPRLVEGEYGKKLQYWGVNQETKKWGLVDTYGGKLVENCLSGDTLVLTNSGWRKITEVLVSDKLWDGLKWVSHEGLIYKGEKETISINGVRLTPDHKILTNHGWKNASQSERYFRHEDSLNYCFEILRIRWQEINLDFYVRLRERISNVRKRVQKREAEILRLSEIQDNIRKEKDAWNDKAPGVCSVAVNVSTLFVSAASGVEKLWRKGYLSLRKMEIILYKFLGRYGTLILTGYGFRPHKQQRELRKRKLPLDYKEDKYSEQENVSSYINSVGAYYCSRSFRKIRNRSYYATLSSVTRNTRKIFVQEAGCYESVYDLKNAGDLNRFTVKAENGQSFIVHNCVQAIARDCLAESMLALDAENYKICVHIHDEVVIETPAENAERELENICKTMGREIPWAKGLPLSAAGYLTPYYKKD